jgi:hypothetical protein
VQERDDARQVAEQRLALLADTQKRVEESQNAYQQLKDEMVGALADLQLERDSISFARRDRDVRLCASADARMVSSPTAAGA